MRQRGSAASACQLAALALALLCLVQPLDAKYHVKVQSVTRHAAAAAPDQWVPEPVASRPKSSTPRKPNTLEHTFTLRWSDIAPDGSAPKPRITINGQYPGPTIVGTQGDRLVVKVHNLLDQPASIHWHGMYQNGTNNMDGIPGLTQDAIMPGTTFVYNYTLDVAGSYWYHSHWKTQYTDGLFGSLVVLDPVADLPHHPVSIIAVSDLYYNNSLQLTEAFLSPSNTEGDEPIPDSCTLNGVGQLANCSAAGTCQYGSVTLGVSEPCSCDESVETCRARGGVTRLMNQAAFATMNITVDEHLFWIVGADSVPIKPTAQVGTIRLNTGQRYDVVMCRKVNKKSTEPAWIRSSMDQETFPDDSPNPHVKGILRYAGASTTCLPTTKPWSPAGLTRVDSRSGLGGGDVVVIDPYNLQPLFIPDPPKPTVTINLVLDIFADPKANGSVLAHFNNISQVDLATIKPNLLWRAQRGLPMPPAAHVVAVDYNDVVEVVINNLDGGEHPIHLHGQNFWITARGEGLFNGYQPGFTNTARDTASVAANSYLVLRYAARNRGLWLMHCHIEWHMASGLGMIWSVGMPK